MLKIRFLIKSFSIGCLFNMHAYCGDPDDMMTPVKQTGLSTVVEFTPGQVMSQRQARILTRENFETHFEPSIVESWGIDWSLLASQTLAYDCPEKASSVSFLTNRLKERLRKCKDGAFLDFFDKIMGIKTAMEAVHGDRLDDKSIEYFSRLFPEATVTTDIKIGGVQLGETVFVTLPEGVKLKYYVKTHSEGRLSSKSSAAKLVAPEELMIYRILQYAGVGCESHFFQRSPEDVYIATLDAAHNGTFRLFKDTIKDETKYGEALWGKLGIINNSPYANDFDALEHIFTDPFSQNFIQQMATLDILTRVLRLQDLLNNPDNFGFVWHSDSYPILRVIDFRVLDEREFKITKDHFRGFLVGNGLYNYAASHKTMRFALHDRNRDKRIETAMLVLSQDPLKSIIGHIEHAYHDIAHYITGQPDFSEQQIALMDKLNNFREAIIANVHFFNTCLHDRTILEEVTA
jgi:hypothetical protein